MIRNDYSPILNELSASEGVFTTAQAARLGIPRNVLSKACESGKLVRVSHGAYRMAGTPASQLDDLAAAWKLTAPSKMSYERTPPHAWDGVAVAGSTAASILGIGDFYASPYRILAPKRINSRNPDVKFGVRRIARDDVSFEFGVPVTRLERTLLDLVLDGEEPSLVEKALEDARKRGLNEDALARLTTEACEPRKAGQVAEELLGKGRNDGV